MLSPVRGGRRRGAMGSLISKPLGVIVGIVYPAYRSFKALETPQGEDDKQWCGGACVRARGRGPACGVAVAPCALKRAFCAREFRIAHAHSGRWNVPRDVGRHSGGLSVRRFFS